MKMSEPTTQGARLAGELRGGLLLDAQRTARAIGERQCRHRREHRGQSVRARKLAHCH